jgi:hypothetical protein
MKWDMYKHEVKVYYCTCKVLSQHLIGNAEKNSEQGMVSSVMFPSHDFSLIHKIQIVCFNITVNDTP